MELLTLLNWPYVAAVILLTELLKLFSKKILNETKHKHGANEVSKVKKFVSFLVGIGLGVAFYFNRDTEQISAFDCGVNLFVSFAVTVFFYDTIYKLIKKMLTFNLEDPSEL